MTTFRYLGLPPVAETGTTPSFTRILYLAPGTGEEPFNGILEIIDVQHCLPYEALSYTWGREDESDYLWIGGIPLPIKPNLAAALRHLRLPTQSRRLWIDAVCIDQASASERSRQVRYMRHVYQHAARVIVWLGTRTPGVDEAFKVAERLARTRELTNPASAGGQLDQAAVTELTLGMIGDLPAGAMERLSELLARPYFSRCWCVQEVVASSWAIAKCDDLEMSFFDLLSSALPVANWRGTVQIDTPLGVWGFVSMRRETQPALRATEVQGSIGQFLFLLGLTRNMRATDDRDKIFSLLGICDEGLQPVLALTQVMGSSNDGWLLRKMRSGITRFSEYANSLGPDVNFGRPRALMADYTRDTVSVYTDLARFLLRKAPRMLDALHHVQHVGDPGEGPFPSWVPRWFEPNSTFVFSGAFLAGLCDGHFRYFAELHDCPLSGEPARPRVLSLDGFRFDAVQAVSEVMEFGASAEEAVDAVSRAWTQLFAAPLFPRAGMRYRDGQMLDVAFCRALLAAPLGSIMGSLGMKSASSLGLHLDLAGLEKSTEAQREKLTVDMIDAFFEHNGGGGGVSPELKSGGGERTALYAGWLTGTKWYAKGRRAFRTAGGRVGIGPRAMRAGDEVVALFGGRMPFVVRHMGTHHLFVGACYVVDDELMWGKVTEKVRFNRGGPPVQTFEIW